VDLNVFRKDSFRSNINLDIVKGIKEMVRRRYGRLLLPAAASCCYFRLGISYSGRCQKLFFSLLTPSFYSENFDEKCWVWYIGRDLVWAE